MAHPSRVFLDEIAGAVAISAAQSAAIVSQVSARLERWIAAKNPPHVVIPSLADLAVHRGGHLWWHRGRMVPQQDTVAAIGGLLDALLQQGPAGRAPAGLLYVVARATDPRHLAPFVSVQDLRSAVARHAPEHASFAIDALLTEYLMATSGCEPLGDESTISDVRRLRRAGGVTLPRISLAATLLAAVVVTAPADRHAKQSAFAGPPAPPAPASLRPVPVTPVGDDPVRSVVAPASNTTPTTPPGRPRSRTSPRQQSNTAAGATTRGSARTVQSPRSRHALARFARALAGDGRHKVEPFPKVQR